MQYPYSSNPITNNPFFFFSFFLGVLWQCCFSCIILIKLRCFRYTLNNSKTNNKKTQKTGHAHVNATQVLYCISYVATVYRISSVDWPNPVLLEAECWRFSLQSDRIYEPLLSYAFTFFFRSRVPSNGRLLCEIIGARHFNTGVAGPWFHLHASAADGGYSSRGCPEQTRMEREVIEVVLINRPSPAPFDLFFSTAAPSFRLLFVPQSSVLPSSSTVLVAARAADWAIARAIARAITRACQ